MSDFRDPKTHSFYKIPGEEKGLKLAIRDGAHRRDHEDPINLPMHFSNLSTSVMPVSKNLNPRTAVSFFANLLKSHESLWNQYN